MSSRKLVKNTTIQTESKIADKSTGEPTGELTSKRGKKPAKKSSDESPGKKENKPTKKSSDESTSKKEQKPAMKSSSESTSKTEKKPAKQKKEKEPIGEPTGELVVSTASQKKEKKAKKLGEDKNNNLANEFRAITITFGEIAENHAGMQKIGSELPSAAANGGVDSGFSFEDLRRISKQLNDSGLCVCEFVVLNRPDILASVADTDVRAKCLASPAGILILRNGVNAVLGQVDGADNLLAEQAKLPVDTKAMMRGKVVNKQARYNLCFSDFSQEPDYAQGRGRVINFTDIPITSELRNRLVGFLGPKADNLQGEGNYYYDIRKCGIGFHGDSERQIVIGTRLGAEFPLEYQWFYSGTAVGARVRVDLKHGDIYIMSSKAVGQDWKRRTIPTLRHAAGANKYLTIVSTASE